eukprot:114395-Prorocentrum_minimum.AAC.1
MLPALARLVPRPGICSPPARDWSPVREYAPRLHAMGRGVCENIGNLRGHNGKVQGFWSREFTPSAHELTPSAHELTPSAHELTPPTATRWSKGVTRFVTPRPSAVTHL